MKLITQNSGPYQTPEIHQWMIQNEGVLCENGNHEAYAGEDGDNYHELF